MSQKNNSVKKIREKNQLNQFDGTDVCKTCHNLLFFSHEPVNTCHFIKQLFDEVKQNIVIYQWQADQLYGTNYETQITIFCNNRAQLLFSFSIIEFRFYTELFSGSLAKTFLTQLQDCPLMIRAELHQVLFLLFQPTCQNRSPTTLQCNYHFP